MSYTPGPWDIDKEYELAVVAPDGGYIAALTTEDGEEPYKHGIEANARLMAAAPEMYEALHAIRARWSQMSDHDFISWMDAFGSDQVIAALAKAVG